MVKWSGSMIFQPVVAGEWCIWFTLIYVCISIYMVVFFGFVIYSYHVCVFVLYLDCICG